MTQTRSAAHGYVSGHVQGVFFRAKTQEKALALGLDGWVRNKPDGRVEFLVCGSSVSVEQMLVWLHQGPPEAVVSTVQSETVPHSGEQGFRILR